MNKKLAPNRATVAGYAIALLVASLLHWLGFPLAWLLGPLSVSAIMSLMGLPISPPNSIRRVGQVAIGSSIGLNLTPAVVLELIGWLPLMLVSVFFVIANSAVFSVFLARLARIDAKTAFYANMPGGLAEMGNIGLREGASPEPIAVVQTLRVAMLLLLLPPALLALGLADAGQAFATEQIPSGLVAPLLLASGGFAYLFGFTKFNNPWMIGALVFTGLATGLGIVSGRMPQPVFSAAQLLIGFAVGAHFRPAMLTSLRRTSMAACIVIILAGLTMIGYAAVISLVTSLDFTTLALATSPGGLAEMVATANVLDLSVAIVVAFHVLRAFTVNGFASYCWMIFDGSGARKALEGFVRTARQP